MKKTIFLIILVLCTYLVIGQKVESKNLIPDDAIRIRIIANSNSEYDQNLKMNIKDKVEKNMYEMLKDAKTINQAKEIIKDNLSNVDKSVNEALMRNDNPYSYNINFGKNYFPSKEYKGIKYKEGYYESLVVTLGKGEGDNWWCVLFPPLCMVEVDDSEVEYTTLVGNIINKYF